jgi:uncharacterized membrane protein
VEEAHVSTKKIVAIPLVLFYLSLVIMFGLWVASILVQGAMGEHLLQAGWLMPLAVILFGVLTIVGSLIGVD